MRSIIIVMLFLFVSPLWATPQKIEMIFLSPERASSLLQHLDQLEKIKMAAFTAQTEDKCVPMGDGCFHPQLGYIEKTPEKPRVQIEEKPNEVKTFNALETSLINCDKNNHFDIFCGQERPEQAAADTEVWIDISSSLREVDYSRDQATCARRTFMTNVLSACPGKARFSVYNTGLKEVGDHSTVCLSHGTNNEKKLVEWIRGSKAKHLLLVTDVDELSPALRELLESNGAKMQGDGVKPFTSKDLIEYAKEFSKVCD